MSVRIRKGYVSPNDWLLRIIVVMIIHIYPKDGLRSTSGCLLPKGRKKGQKLITLVELLPFQGVADAHRLTQGVALGYWLIAPSGRYRVIADNH